MPWFSIFLLLLVIPLIPTAYAGLIGAPWVPSRREAVDKAMKDLNIGPGDTVIDLGAGSGTVLLSAAARGATALGYELSPIMWLAAKLRTSAHPPGKGGKGGFASIKFKNFYKQTLSPETTVIFAFLMPDNMPRLKKYLASQNLPNLKHVLAYTFPFKDIPPRRIIKTPQSGAIYVYDPPSLAPPPAGL